MNHRKEKKCLQRMPTTCLVTHSVEHPDVAMPLDHALDRLRNVTNACHENLLKAAKSGEIRAYDACASAVSDSSFYAGQAL
jgi:hypothetical protein